MQQYLTDVTDPGRSATDRNVAMAELFTTIIQIGKLMQVTVKPELSDDEKCKCSSGIQTRAKSPHTIIRQESKSKYKTYAPG